MPIDPENNVPLDAEQIAEMADAGKSISQFFTSPGVMKPGLKKQTR
ncbi:hypothetical protein SAMN05421770_11217 [Granulicella rosea]|uniref:Uncharacterized protein n=2 Tax=Granulicella rosea TaxID=474952 RepID=A0A239MDZ5_9BACT|nr:hypothetical protein SAMN05421770_11217 [Granulicella rosea]